MFCAGYNHYFFRYAFPLNSDDFSVKAFSCSCILCLFSQQFYGLFYHLIFRDISLNSQETFVLFFRCISFNIQWILFVLTFFVSYLLSYPCYIRLFIRLFFRLFIRYFFVLSFELFSILIYLFIYFVFVVLVKLC